jgi:hypothetical protein
MSILDYFRREGSWREKTGALAKGLVDIEAERERLEQEAAAALLSGDEDKGRADRDRRLSELTARARDLQRALSEAETKAAADEAAAEAERRRQEEEAARRRREEAERAYLEQASQVERAVKALTAAVVEMIERGQAIITIDGSRLAERSLNAGEIVERIANTQWKHLRVGGSPARPMVLFPYDVGGYQGARPELRESEGNLLAALRGEDGPTAPVPVRGARRSPRPLLAPDEPEAA